MKIVSLFFVFLIAAFVGCKKNNSSSNFSLHQDYFPIEKGRYVIYEVKEINHDAALQIHDTIQYLLKSKIGESFTDNEDNLANELNRYTSFDGGLSWSIKDVWPIQLVGNRAEVVEENQRIVKLLFAPSLDKEWNSNIYNTFDKQLAHYSSIHEPFQLGLHSFDSVVVVEHSNFTSLIDFKKHHEVYAKGIGLVQKTFKNLEILNFDSLNVQKGKELYMNCVSFGFE